MIEGQIGKISQGSETFNLQMAASRVMPRVTWKG